jgi:uncharacterized protein YbjT (DUF2867 family)
MGRIILVTGATGTLGTEVTRLLSQWGVHVRAAAHTVEKAGKFKGLDVEVVELDYGRPETMERAFEGVDRLFLLTPMDSEMGVTTARLVDAAKRVGVRQIVKQSVMAAGEVDATFMNWHREAELIVEGADIPFTHLRPNAFMQNFINYHGEGIRKEGAFRLPCGDGKVSFVDVGDIAKVAVQALVEPEKHKNSAYTITGPEALSHGEAARVLSNALKREIKYVDIPEDKAREAMGGAGMPQWQVEGLMELYGLFKAGSLSAVSPALREVTGEEPVRFEQFARDHAGSFK